MIQYLNAVQTLFECSKPSVATDSESTLGKTFLRVPDG
jgi:hypothetical protein